MLEAPVLLSLPDWRGGAPGNWLTDWEARLGLRRVEREDGPRPLRGDWIARLEETVLDLPGDAPAVLVADGLGCLQAAAWAAHSRQAGRVRSVLLVAPRDLDGLPDAAPLSGWRRPIGALPAWQGLVVAGRGGTGHAGRQAQAWGLPLAVVEPPPERGAWPAGEALLRRLLPAFHVEHGAGSS
ncbi:MAG: alpha/beta hydrolase [Xylophilus ampelinus]